MASLLAFEGKQRMHQNICGTKPIGSTQVGQIDHEERRSHLSPSLSNQLGCCESGSARGDKIVDQRDL